MVTVERKREAVVFLKTKEVSERRSCQLIFLARSTCQYRRRRKKPDEEFEKQIKKLAFAHPRYGYRRVHALLKRSGQKVNRKRVVRVWQKFALQVPRSKKSKKRVRQTQPVMPTASHPNEVWTYDFVFDRDAAGRRLKLLTMMDEFTREGLAIRVGRSFKATQVKEVLREVGARRGFPQFLRSDNGSEFIAGIIKEFLAENNIKAAYIEPGSPWQNGKGESFNGKFRDECLRMEIFGNLKEAEVIAEQWRKFYNTERPHSSLGYQTPEEFKRDWEKRQRLLKNVTRQKLAISMAQGLGS